MLIKSLDVKTSHEFMVKYGENPIEYMDELGKGDIILVRTGDEDLSIYSPYADMIAATINMITLYALAIKDTGDESNLSTVLTGLSIIRDLNDQIMIEVN